jgi:hypothetical protein
VQFHQPFIRQVGNVERCGLFAFLTFHGRVLPISK